MPPVSATFLTTAIENASFVSKFETGGLVDSEHDVHILHGGARRPLAEIVEPRNEQNALIVAVNGYLHAVAARERRGRKKTILVGRILVFNDAFAVILAVESLDVLEPAAEILRKNRHRNLHSGIVRNHDRHERRRTAEAADFHDFRQMLVLLAERILSAAEFERIESGIIGDHLLAAAGKTGQ
jgi:hypothetical protein